MNNVSKYIGGFLSENTRKAFQASAAEVDSPSALNPNAELRKVVKLLEDTTRAFAAILDKMESSQKK